MHQLTALGAPDVDALVEATRGKKFAVWAERNRVHRFRMFCERVDANAPLYVPQANGRIEGRTRQDEVHVGILRARTRR